MKYLSIIILLTATITSCNSCCQLPTTSDKTLADTVYLRDTSVEFEYRNILEDYIDSVRPKDIKGLFGIWTITSVAKIGGSAESEELIQSQIGHKLHVDNDSLTFNFLNKSITVDKPVYSVEYFRDEKSLKATSLFEGYRPCRKSAIMLDVSEKLYLEVIHFQEMVYYYDGRIYFLTRDS